VAALGVGGELDLVYGEELDRAVEGHRFDRADEIARPLRNDLLLAGDQGDGAAAAHGTDPVVDLAREEPQRAADHAGLVTEHALDGQMGLSGIGRAEHRRDATRASMRLRSGRRHLREEFAI